MKNNKDPRFINAYNHKSISTDGKPIISNRQFKELSENLTFEALAAAKELYSFERTQEKILLDRLNNRIV